MQEVLVTYSKIFSEVFMRHKKIMFVAFFLFALNMMKFYMSN